MSLFPALYAPEDVTSGHGCWPPVGYAPPPVGASPNVLINGLPVHRVGDVTLPHLCTGPDLHPDVISTGYPKVLVNGTPIAINGMSVLAPSGVVNGLASVNVICKPGPMNTPNLAGLAKIAAAIAARALIGPPFGIPGSNGGVPGGGDSDQTNVFPNPVAEWTDENLQDILRCLGGDES